MESQVHERRAHPRVRVIWKGMITGADVRAGCRVLNVSDNGALIECSQRIAHDDPIILEFGNGTRRACAVVWSESTQFGVRFLGAER